MRKAPPFMKQRGADPNAAMRGDVQQSSDGAKPGKKPTVGRTAGQYNLPRSKKRKKHAPA